MHVITNELAKLRKEMAYMESCLYMEFSHGRTRIHVPAFWESFDNWIV